jgi:hypothetical protein
MDGVDCLLGGVGGVKRTPSTFTNAVAGDVIEVCLEELRDSTCISPPMLVRVLAASCCAGETAGGCGGRGFEEVMREP